MSKPDCTTCTWAEPILTEQEAELILVCRRFPPSVDAADKTSWPVVHETDWCGEWAARSVEQERDS